MSDYDYLPVSDGSGDAALMHIETDRITGSTTIDVDSVAGVPAKFIGTYGTLLPSGFLDPATKRDFKGHLSTGDVIIDSFESGSTDGGNTAGQVVIVKPNTGWANRVATFIKNATNFGTPEDFYVNDLHVAGSLSVDGGGLLPPGSVLPFGGASLPAGYLLCNGAAVSRTTYAALFGAIGTLHGTGDGSTTFNLPDGRGRQINGYDSAQTEFNAVGLKAGQMALQAHSHTGATAGAGYHDHQSTTSGQNVFTAGSNNHTSGDGAYQQITWGNTRTSADGNHAHSFTTDNTGSGTNNLNPYITLNYIIKT